MKDIKLEYLDEQQRRALQEYIFDLEEIKEKAEELTLAHEKLERSQELLLTVLSCTVHGLCLVREGGLVFGNEALGEILGWESAELAGNTIDILFCNEEARREMGIIIDSGLRQGGFSCEFELKHKDGDLVPCFITGRALDKNEPARGYVLSIIDFTERRNSRIVLEKANFEMGRHSEDLTRMNQTLSREIEERKRAEEKLNSYSEELEERVRIRTAELSALNDTLLGEIEERRIAQDHLQSEIAMRMGIEEALRQSENEYRAIFENTGTAMIIIEDDMTISLANAEFEFLSGVSREHVELRKKWSEFFVEDDLALMREYHRLRRIDPGMAPRQYEARFVNTNGELKQVAMTVSIIPGTMRSIASILDITLLKEMEAEALKAQKLESIGILAGGIAHDFNNILTAIVGNISLAKLSARPGDRILKKLEETEKASLRAKDLTQQLLTFSKGGQPVKKVLSLGALLKDTAGFSLRGSDVRLELRLPEDLFPVEADEGQIGQVINNIIINADQAMPIGGVIEIVAENVELEPKSTLPLTGGKYVKVTVKDQGIGISEEHFGKIFDPYFSTKQKGSGLELATVYSIIKRHGGHIGVNSEIGSGTTFTFYLPASQSPLPEPDEHPPEEPASGKGRVLVMDDEQLIHEVLGEMLSFMGYEPSFATDGVQAIEMYNKSKKSDHPFDLLIMDLTIPGGMGGKDALKKLLALYPDVKAIVSSGYSNDPVMSDFEKYGFIGVVSKPYRIEELSQVLQKVLS